MNNDKEITAEEKLSSKGYDLSKIRNKGRWQSPGYVDYVLEKVVEKFPDANPQKYLVRACIQFFLAYIDEAIQNGDEVKLRGFGTFKLEKRVIKAVQSKNLGDEQYYPNFKFSNKYIRYLRFKKGTSSLSELQSLRKDKDFQYNTWLQRHKYRLENNMTISPNNQKQFAKSTAEYKEFMAKIDELEQAALEKQLNNPHNHKTTNPFA